MSERQTCEALIGRLGADLVPVRRLWSPSSRAAGWLLVVAVIGALLLWHYGDQLLVRRWAAAPDVAWAGIGAMLTAVTAALAAFSLGVPGRSVRWAWLPLPAAALWVSASGLGCLQALTGSGAGVADLQQSMDCLMFIIGFSVPLSALMLLMLRRACPLRPVLSAVVIGLASAAASASLLEICHAHDSAATDLLTHAAAVAIVVGINAAMGGRLLLKA